MVIYAIIATIVAVIFGIRSLMWKVSMQAVILFCIENFREPTAAEIADYSKEAARKTLKFKK